MTTSVQDIDPAFDSAVRTANMVGVVLSNITYGVHLTLFIRVFRIYYSASQRPQSEARSRRRMRRPSLRPLLYFSLLLILATVGLCLQTWLDHSAFIENRDYAGGPLAYMVAHAGSSGCLGISAVYLILNWLSDGMLLYRFYILFQCSRYAIILSILTFLSLIAVGTVSIRHISMLSVNLLSNTSINLATVYLSLSFSLNLLLSLAIVLRMLHLRRSVPFVLNSRSSTRLYTSIVAMFVESASLYTLISLVCIIAVGLAIPMQNALLPMLGQLQAIPPLLISIRVSEYRATPVESFSSSMPSTIKFRRPLTPGINFGRGLILDDEQNPPPYPERCLSRSTTSMYEKRDLEECGQLYDPDATLKPSHSYVDSDFYGHKEDATISTAEEGFLRFFDAPSDTGV
ncbi:hypothetical protein C8Q80DRAFT_1178274 [Daedaleopsis nitida]|nr:hypothetical protein C8Q80DRAFT_1178274 [Daedaleopsis nitida]